MPHIMTSPDDRPCEAWVAAGIALLAEREPGAVDLIDLESLDIADPWRCVLAQTWTGGDVVPATPYAAHADALGLTVGDWRYGFALPPMPAGDDEFEQAMATLDDLDAEWRRQLTALRTEAGSPMTATHTADLAHADAQAVHIADCVVHRLTPGTSCGDPNHHTAVAWYGTELVERSFTGVGPTPTAALVAAMALLGVAVGTPGVREGAQVNASERSASAAELTGGVS